MQQQFAQSPVACLTQIKVMITVITRKLLKEFEEKIRVGHESSWTRSTTPRRPLNVIDRGEIFE
jgi:hypothetical protein